MVPLVRAAFKENILQREEIILPQTCDPYKNIQILYYFLSKYFIINVNLLILL